jgi:PAS domain-containing protein
MFRVLVSRVLRYMSAYRSGRTPRNQNILSDMALSHMTQGVNMLDSAGRLVLSNQRYIEMYGLSPEVVKPGCTVPRTRLAPHRSRQLLLCRPRPVRRRFGEHDPSA